MATNPTEGGKRYIGIVVDRDDPNGLGGHKIFCPQLHGHDVKVEHLPWVRYTVPPGSAGSSTNYGALDNGQMVIIEKEAGQGGSGFGTIVGAYQTLQKSDPNMPGNVSLIKAFRQIADSLQSESNVRVRPEIEEVMVDGAIVRRAKEKGIKHKHNLLNGIMSHAATYPLNGTILPQVTNISTGVEPSQNILTSAIQALLPGAAISINQIFNLMPPELLDEIFSSVPPEIKDAMLNTTALMGGVTTMSTNGSSSGRRVDPIQFALDAANILKGINTPGGVAQAFGQLVSDTTLGALPTEALNIPIDTPYGPMIQVVDPITGEITYIIPPEVQESQNNFGSLMGSLPGASGSNIFGDSSSVMNSLGQRLADAALVSTFKTVVEKNISTSSGTESRKKVNASSTGFIGGGN